MGPTVGTIPTGRIGVRGNGHARGSLGSRESFYCTRFEGPLIASELCCSGGQWQHFVCLSRQVKHPVTELISHVLFWCKTSCTYFPGIYQESQSNRSRIFHFFVRWCHGDLVDEGESFFMWWWLILIYLQYGAEVAEWCNSGGVARPWGTCASCACTPFWGGSYRFKWHNNEALAWFSLHRHISWTLRSTFLVSLQISRQHCTGKNGGKVLNGFESRTFVGSLYLSLCV